ncbi:MAG TPA: DUF3108 domain-containing protein [Anaeromyxobacteraceae bacterium]|nr:DUF3108 domain-containing protein [Anaeromyxobacteraceae bacterium]
MPAALLPLALALAAPPPAALPFRQGEQMEFQIEYLGIKMGAARIWVGRPEGSILPVFMQARTGGLTAMLDVREQLVSNLDAGTGLPRSSSLEAVELGYRHGDSTTFDREGGKAIVRSRGKYGETVKEVEAPPGTMDFVALIFRLRSLPLDTGARHEFSVLAGSKVSAVTAEVTGRESVETKAGRFPSVRVRVPTGFTGKFSEKNPTIVWLSDDARRVVVQISTDFAIGHAVARLSAYRPGSDG